MDHGSLGDNVYHVIMAGGSGTRFWPASRAARPKQFLALAGDSPLLAQAWDRAAAMSGPDRVYVAAGPGHRAATLRALPGLDPSRFIEEPCARNTAGCVGLSALRLARRDPAAVLIMAPADHIYADVAALTSALARAVQAARDGRALVTLGIRPGRPETGFGYIELAGQEAAPPGGAAPLPAGVHRAARFVEKPDEPTARAYLASGRHLWNSGIFIWRADAILRELRTCAPDLWARLEPIGRALGTADEARVTAESFAALRSVSIDYAVLEKAGDVLVVPVDPGWSDVGSWDAAADLRAVGPDGNALTGGAAELVAVDSTRCFVQTEGASLRAVALIGVEDLVVVDTGDALLICRRGRSQSVREVVEALKGRQRHDLL